MKKRLMLFLVLIVAGSLPLAYAQKDSGKPFAGRDPHTCTSRKAGLNAAQAKQYFICDAEKATGPLGTADLTGELHLVTDVTVEVGKGRPFNMQADSFGWATDLGIDPSQTVYPIRGGYNRFDCVKIGYFNGDPGKNCTKAPQPEAKGICFKTTFGDWHCTMTDFDHSPTMERFPAPKGD